MTDVVDPATRSRMMSGIRSNGTRAEIFLRLSLYRMGYRYRLGGCGLPGRPDLVFSKRRLVVFVHGCFWHMHGCQFFKWPSTNAKFWRDKIESNHRRDGRSEKLLASMNWRVVIVWECELRSTKFTQPNAALLRVADILGQPVLTVIGKR